MVNSKIPVFGKCDPENNTLPIILFYSQKYRINLGNRSIYCFTIPVLAGEDDGVSQRMLLEE